MIETGDRSEVLSDEELVLKCAERPVDEVAWNEFYVRYYKLVHRLVRRILQLSQGEVDEVVQEAFTRIFQILPAYDPHKARIKTYISSVVRNLTIDFLRHGSVSRSLAVSLADEIEQIQDRQSGAIERLAAEIVDSIPDKGKIPLLLALIGGEDVKAICKRFGRTQYEVYEVRTWLRKWLLKRKQGDAPKSLKKKHKKR